MANPAGRRWQHIPDDHHSLPSMIDPHTRAPSRVRYDDPISDTCPACTLEWSGGQWHHDRACPFRQAVSGAVSA
jgi:hypothetical protein